MTYNAKRKPKAEPPPLPAGPWVCAEGHDVKASDVQPGIDNRPIGLCWPCRRQDVPLDNDIAAKRAATKPVRSRLVPVMLKSEWQPKAPKPRQATPEAMFADAEVPRGFLDEGGRVVALHEERRGRRDRA